MKIIIEGNDGTGKTTLVSQLQKQYPNLEFKDRDFVTKMTDVNRCSWNEHFQEHYKEGDRIILLDASLMESIDALTRAGKDLTEKYHKPSDLVHYRFKFAETYFFLRDEKKIPIILVNVMNDKSSEQALNTIEDFIEHGIMPKEKEVIACR